MLTTISELQCGILAPGPRMAEILSAAPKLQPTLPIRLALQHMQAHSLLPIMIIGLLPPILLQLIIRLTPILTMLLPPEKTSTLLPRLRMATLPPLPLPQLRHPNFQSMERMHQHPSAGSQRHQLGVEMRDLGMKKERQVLKRVGIWV